MTKDLAKDERKALEDYLLAGDDEELARKAINQNVQGSVPYYYLHYLHMFKTVGIDGLSEEERVNLKKFTESDSFKDTWQAKQIALRYKLLKYDNEKTDKEERKKIIEDLLQPGFEDELQQSTNLDEESDQESQKQDKIDKSSLAAVAPHLFENQKWRVGGLISTNDKQKETYATLQECKQKLKEAEQAGNNTDGEQRKLKIAKSEHKDNCDRASQCLRDCVSKDEGFIHDFDFTNILPSIVYFAFSLTHLAPLAHVQNESILVQIAAYVRGLSKEKLSDFTIPGEKLSSLTLAQMDKLADLTPWLKQDENFIGTYFQKQFAEELLSENQDSWSKQEKLDMLNRLYEHAKSKGMPNGFQLEFLMEILKLGPQCGVYSKQELRDWINLSEKTIDIYEGADKRQEMKEIKKLEMRKSKINQRPEISWNQFITKLAPSKNTSTQEIELIRKYLTHFCVQNNGSLAEYAKDFKKTFLGDIERKTKVMLSKDGMTSLGDDVDLNYFKSIADKVVLEFSENNRQTFDIEEEVKLNVTLKNIQKLNINIFEFNTETYYKKNLKPFDTSVDLDGLLASEQENHQYDHSSNYQHTQTFTFPALNNKIGLFIVEFVGNGVNARAVIKKGRLSMVHRSTTAGHLCYLLDQNKEICLGDKRTGVYFDSKFYDADKEKGRIFIPYGRHDLASKIIMVHGDFAQLGEFTRKTERYEFSAKCYLNTESILMGSSTNIVIKPQLRINGRKADVNMLKSSKVVVQTSNYIDNVPITRNFDGISFDNHSECTIQFQVPPSLGSVRVSLTTQVLNATTKKMEDFSHSEEFPILTQATRSTTTDAFLQRKKDGYKVSFLGKNGEPQAKKSIEVVLSHRAKGKETVMLQTDSNGVVHLGFLEDINNIQVQAQSLHIGASFILPDYFSENASSWNHQSELRLLEGDSFDLPINMRRGETTLKRMWLSLIREINGIIVEDWFDKVQLKHNGDGKTGHHSIKVDGLDQGLYQLSYLSGNKRHHISIHVTKGLLWEANDSFILKDHCLIERLQSSMIPRISNVQITEKQEEAKDGSNETHSLRVEVDQCSKDAHMLLLATSFIPHDSNQLGSMLYNMQTIDFSASVFHFSQWNNLYQSNRQLSDEIRYVFDRKKLDSQLGNSLDRPSLLMKRNYVRQTEVVEEKLATGTRFKHEAEKEMEMHSRSRRCEGRLQGVRGGKCHGSAGGSFRTNEITEVQNFLKNPPIQKFNLKPVSVNDEQGSVVFDVSTKLAHFEHLQVIVVDKDSVTQRLIDLDSASIVKRDLRLNKKLDESKGLTETRSNKTMIAEVRKGYENKDFIEDITSSEVTVVDDMLKVNEILEEVYKLKGSHHNIQYTKFYSFIGKWANGSLTRDEKDKYYTEYLCHELNLFIKKRDPDYFKAVVRPFLQCKMEKTFVDEYLLGNHKKVARHSDFHLIQNLNAMEQCLLIDSMVQLGMQDKARMLAEKIDLEVKASRTDDSERRIAYENKIFDLVLNLNNLNDVKGGLEKIKEKAVKVQRMNMEMEQNSQLRSFAEPMMQMKCAAPVSLSSMPGQERFRALQAPMQNRSLKMKKMKLQSNSLRKETCAAFEEDEEESFNRLRQQLVKKEKFEEVEQTSEYMETHYYNNTNINSYASLVTKNAFWATYADYLVNGVSKQTEQPKFRRHQFEQTFEKRLTCENGHPVVACGTQQKQRVDEEGKPLCLSSGLNCDSCGKNFVVQDGFYSCAETCDFDLCSSCSCDPKGNILVKQKGLPEAYNKINSQVQCDRCEKILSKEQLDQGFLRGPTGEFDVCRTCVPCAEHTWKQVLKQNKSDQNQTEKQPAIPVGERGPFLSSFYTECTDSPIEAFLVGCFLDIPFKAKGEHEYQPDEQRGVTIKAGSNLILYKKEIQETDIAVKADLLVIHRYNKVDGAKSKHDSGIPETFFTNTVYECEVIITNVSPKSKQFTLLYQVPQGSMPMKKTKYMKSHYMSLNPFTTNKTVFQFYFPSAGHFNHFPSNVSVDQIVVAKGSQNTLRVEANKRITEIQTFQDLLKAGSKEDVLKYLQTENLTIVQYGDGGGGDSIDSGDNGVKNFDFQSMLYLLKDKDFFTATIKILRERAIYEYEVWKYAFYHKDDEELMRECITLSQRCCQFQNLGTHFQSKLVTRNEKNEPKVRRSNRENAHVGFTNHLEYHPMVNQRAHRVGQEGTHSIQNKTFSETYNMFLQTLVQKQNHNGLEDKMIFVYYLQLQDRIQEAIALFKTIQAPEKDSILKVQYDYLLAYFDFFTGADDKYLVARRIVQQYDNFPIRKWRMMFLAILDQLNEFDGEFDEEGFDDPIDANELAGNSNIESEVALQRQQNKKKAIQREPNISQIDISDDGTIKIETVNIKTVTVKYYLINAELLFSRSPFLKSNAESFSYVAPFQHVKKQMLPDDADEGQLNAFVTQQIPLPNELKNMNANLVIEINGGDLQKFHTFYQNQLKVTVLETFGELKVCDSAGKPMQKVYVKVYFKSKVTEKDYFYRDGYTDIRGKMDYAQTSGDKLKDVKRFSILVQSDTLGSKIQEANPPKGDGDFGHNQSGSSGMTGLAASKMNRMANRQQQKTKMLNMKH